MYIKLLRSGLFIGLIILSYSLHAQISHGGEPIIRDELKSQVASVVLPAFQIEIESEVGDSKEENSRLKHAKYAYKYDVEYAITNSGKWDNLDDGRRVWRFSIRSEGAYSLGLEFSKFNIPVGGKVFVYNNSSNTFLGAFTNENNKKSGRFSIAPLKGDHLILQYIEPVNVDYLAEMEISGVLHDYKNIFNLLAGKESSTKASGSCNVDINCEEGEDWQIEKKSVCHISYVQNGSGYVASGVLMNNTNQDAKPYLLTAFHVMHEQSIADGALFYFNYENSICNGNDASRTQSISGATLRSTTSKLDFSLLELSVSPPASYNPYYAGWDRSGRIPAYTYCIHHPSGDAKKISFDNDSPVTATYSDGRYTFDDNTSWQIINWEFGTTEGGSSGSPLFDENHRVIGDLTGGDANCESSVNDYYAKFSASWANYSSNNEQLKYWLDPLSLGVETLDGFDPYGGLLANFSMSADTICSTSSITLTDFSNGSPDTYFWDFGEGALPANANISGPHTINYSSKGIKQVKLIVGKGEVKDSIIKNIVVQGLPIVDFDYQLEQLTVSMVNLTTDASKYSWSFGDGGTSIEENPVHTYENSGKYTISLSAESLCGEVGLNKEILTSYNKQLKVYPNPSQGEFTIDLSKIVFENFTWSIYSTKGSQVKNGTISQYSNSLNFNLNGLNAGVYILKMNVDGEILKRKLLLVK